MPAARRPTPRPPSAPKRPYPGRSRSWLHLRGPHHNAHLVQAVPLVHGIAVAGITHPTRRHGRKTQAFETRGLPTRSALEQFRPSSSIHRSLQSEKSRSFIALPDAEIDGGQLAHLPQIEAQPSLTARRRPARRKVAIGNV